VFVTIIQMITEVLG